MEVNRRRRSSSRGFMITKLMPFCRAVKPPPSHDLYNNVHYTSSTTTSYAPQPDYNNYAPKVSFLLKPSEGNKDMEKKLNMMAEKLMIGRGGLKNGGDESVDARAASYISSVRERFKLDHPERLTTVISLDDDANHN